MIIIMDGRMGEVTILLTLLTRPGVYDAAMFALTTQLAGGGKNWKNDSKKAIK